MSILASLLLAAVISQLPPSEFADTEVSTNIPFAVSLETMSRVEFTLGLAGPAPRKDGDVDLVRRMQEDVTAYGVTPFSADEIRRIREMMDEGTIRRFGAIADHRSIGYVANALTAWQVPPEHADAVGAALARSPAVSHCYARRIRPDWPYSLYAMVHARSADELNGICRSLAEAGKALVGREVPSRIMETRREYKKTSMRYFQ